MKRGHWQAAAFPPITHGVVICSYKRPKSLLQCLAALSLQRRRPNDVVVVIRESDSVTHQALQARPCDGLPVRVVKVTAPGVVHARNAGLNASRADILTFTDDDTIAQPEWLERIFDHFVKDPVLGGVGGRDRCHDGEKFNDGRHSVVGRLQWFGRTIGNHHLGFGSPREVHFLKGANMSYRAEAIATLHFDLRLRGNGTQPHEDLGFSLAVRRSGWKLIYDPTALVEHYAGPRDEPRYYDASTKLADHGGYFDTCYNNVVALWDTLPPIRRAVYAVWVLLIGMRSLPGLIQAVRLTPQQGRLAWRKFLLCQQAHLAAYAVLIGRPTRRAAESGRGEIAV